MSNSSSSGGVALIVFGVIAASWIITQVTGAYSHWAFVVPGIAMGLVAVAAIIR
jgi:hypothetical protein